MTGSVAYADISRGILGRRDRNSRLQVGRYDFVWWDQHFAIGAF